MLNWVNIMLSMVKFEKDIQRWKVIKLYRTGNLIKRAIIRALKGLKSYKTVIGNINKW
jgi:hypothetical protein